MCITSDSLVFSREFDAQDPVHSFSVYAQALCTETMHKSYAQQLMHNAQGAVHRKKTAYMRELMLDSISRMLSCRPLAGLASFSSTDLMAWRTVV